ncbi:5110_t:CDS:2, partial [Scutellospora calospora]
DDLVNYSEDETPIQRDMSKRPPDWITKRKITPDGVPIYSYGPKIVHQWSRDMMLLFLDCIEENLDVFWKHTYMFWTWLAKNVFTNKTPEALSQKFRQLRPDNKQIRNFKKKPENAKLIEKIERLYQLLNEKRTWSRDRDVNVNFKYPPGYNQEEANSENNITKPLPTVSLKIDESHLKLAKHLLKYSRSDDNADELRVTIAPELEKVLFMRPKSSKTLSKTADASITLYTDESRLEFKPLIYTLNEDLNKKDDLMSQEIGFVTDMVNNFNEQSTKYFRPPTLELRNEADDYMF